MEYQQLKTKQQKILLKIDLVIGVVSLAILVGSIVHIFTNIFNVGYFSNLSFNWDSSVIIDFKKIPNDGDSQLVFFYIGEFTDGCGCPTKTKGDEESNESYIIYKGKCSKFQLNNNCTDIDAIHQKIITQYNGSNGSQVYYTPDQSDYLSLLERVENETSCKTGYQKCGILDSLNQPFCNTSCSFVYSIKLSNETESNDSIELGNQSWIYEKALNDSDKHIISEITSADDKPCIDSTDFSLSFLYNVLYEYYKKDGDTCNYHINYKGENINMNPFYHIIGKTKLTINDILQANDYSFSKELQNSGDETNKLNKPINILYRSYIGFKEECFKNQEKYKNTFIREGINEDYNKSFSNFKICVIMLGLDLFSMIIVIGISFSSKCLLLIRLVKQVAYLFDILLAINVFCILKFESIYNECGDDLTNLMISNAHKSLRKQELLTFIYLIFSIIVFGINVVECYLQRKDINEKKANDEIKLELYS